MREEMKNIHFLVPRPLYEEFHKNFPEVGFMKTFFTKLMQLAIENVSKRDYFVESIYKEAMFSEREEEEE